LDDGEDDGEKYDEGDRHTDDQQATRHTRDSSRCDRVSPTVVAV
jgi:hypothetical protein